ncbi:MAG: AzlD domain-containing protein, partial [Spirochaetaceae bacterium]
MNEIPIILGMLAVTFIPRVVPFVLPAVRRPPPWLARILDYVPAAALAALIVPGGFTAAGGHALPSVAALLVAAGLSLLRLNAGVTLAAAVGV